MKINSPTFHTQNGFSMMEVLISLLVLLLGLLGLAGVMVQSQRAEIESYQRTQALVLLQDMVDRINANRRVAPCYAFTNAASGEPFLGNGTSLSPNCTLGTSEQYLRANSDLTDWSNLLLGSAERSGTTNLGAMVGARGCISIDTTTTPPTYRISVAWQGLSRGTAPTSSTCATNQYGDGGDTQRRVVTTTIRMATLGES